MRRLFGFALAGFATLTFGAAARAACPTFHQLTNGYPADATQVMDNYNYILQCPNFTGDVGIVQTVSAIKPDLDIRLDNGSGTSAALLTVNHSNSYANSWATLPSRSVLDVGIYGDSTGTGYSAVFRGNVGLGTQTPGSKLSILQTVSATSPYLDIRLDNGSGSSASMLTVNAVTSYANSDATIPSRSILDVGTYGDSTGKGNSAVFRGKVGIGTASPAQALEVNGQIKVDSLASASSTSLCITAPSNGVIATCSSSIRYKENVKSAGFGLKEVEAMRPVTFKWKGRDEQDFGLIAEEVAKIDPRFVTYKDGKIEGVKYPQLTAILVNAVKELKATNDAQTEKAALQAAEMAQLRQQNTALSGRLKQQAAEVQDVRSRLASLERMVSVHTAENLTTTRQQ